MHLGARVSALLDGRLPAAEEERAWSHVHECHPCRDLVEREGWVKTRLAGLSLADRSDQAAPDRLKDALLASSSLSPDPTSPLVAPPFVTAPTGARHRHRSLVVIGGGAAGAAVFGVLALGAAGAPQFDRRAPISDLSRPTPSLSPTVVDRASEHPSRRSPGQHSNRVDTSRRGMAHSVEVAPRVPRVTMAP